MNLLHGLFLTLGLACGCCAAQNTVSLADFGGAPDDGLDDTAAFQNLFSQARNQPGLTVLLEPGVYDLAAEEGAFGSLFVLRNVQQFTMNGEGAILRINTPTIGLFKLIGCVDVSLKGFSVGYDPVPFAWGKVVEVEQQSGTIIVEANPESPSFVEPWITKNGLWGYFMDDTVPGRLTRGMPNVLFLKAPPEETAVGTFAIPLTCPPDVLRKIEPGMVFMLNARENRSPLLIAQDCRNLLLERIISYGSVGGHYLAVDSEGLSFIGCEAKIGRGMIKGGNADFIHVQNARGPIVIRDNVVEGISDDAINLYSKPFFLLDQLEPRRLQLSADARTFAPRKSAGQLRVGDGLVIFDREKGEIVARTRITSVFPEEGIVDVSDPLPELMSRKEALGFYGTGFNRGVLIEGNTFKNSRRFGVFLKAYDVELSKNTFTGLSGPAIFMCNEPGSYREGLFCENVEIVSNRIIDCGFSSNFDENKNWGIITIEALRAPHIPIEDIDAFHDITLVNNVIEQCTRGMNLRNITGLKTQ
ncbi:hypothetical protein H5P28_04215 [Ruficoccus amylovorans]|uniref:Right handed beta helix domain-containing protein n=1 Tax=Ruficoccus amylovorans TaxID=1804625 RepID=A0A842HBD5_9BACT|nr:right-handed parallel beta-helix repeat-containing protein [Ruficoccus amylovorans]MBC2593459.1 hypothetical protein [Ruficoccus amylovorans]